MYVLYVCMNDSYTLLTWLHVKVYCCKTIEEAEIAFRELLGKHWLYSSILYLSDLAKNWMSWYVYVNLEGKSKYEGGFNEAVLVQEYSDGQEYAVDTVVRMTLK